MSVSSSLACSLVPDECLTAAQEHQLPTAAEEDDFGGFDAFQATALQGELFKALRLPRIVGLLCSRAHY